MLRLSKGPWRVLAGLFFGLTLSLYSSMASAYTLADLQQAESALTEANYELLQIEAEEWEFYEKEVTAFITYQRGLETCKGTLGHPLDCEDGWWNEYQAALEEVKQSRAEHSVRLAAAQLVKDNAAYIHSEIYTALYG